MNLKSSFYYKEQLDYKTSKAKEQQVLGFNPYMFYNPDSNTTGWYVESVLDSIKNNPKKLTVLKENGFVVDNKINWPRYKLNEFAFRTDDWTEGEKGAIFLGCSDFYGVGNYLENTASYKIAEHLKLKHYNLSIPGGGLDHLYRVLKYHIKDINADKVLLLIPESSRREFYTESNHVGMSPTSIDLGLTENQLSSEISDINEHISKVEYTYYNLMCNKHYLLVQLNKNIDAIKTLARENNKELIMLFNPFFYKDKISMDIRKQLKSKEMDLACDLIHRGKNFQKVIAEKFIEKLCQ